MKLLYGFLYLVYLLNRPSCTNCCQSSSSSGRHCPTDSTREITRPWLRETGKKNEESWGAVIKRAVIIVKLPAYTHDPPTDFIESCALQVPVRPNISLPPGCRSEWVTTGARRALVSGYLGKRGHWRREPRYALVIFLHLHNLLTSLEFQQPLLSSTNGSNL